MTYFRTWLGRAGLAAALAGPLLEPTHANADGAPVTSATAEQKSRAQQFFTEASAKASRGEHSDALAGFEASFEVVASPNAKLMIARQLFALERWVKAYEAFDAAIDLASASGDPKYELTVKQAGEAKSEIAPKVARLRVDLGGRAATVNIGGKQLTASAIASGVAVEPGPVTIVFESAGVRTSQSVTAAVGKETVVPFEPDATNAATSSGASTEEPATQTPGTSASSDGSSAAVPLMATGGVLLGVGAAGIIVFAAFGVTTLKTSSDLQESCLDHVCDPELESQVEDAKTEQVVANIGAGVGFGAAALGLALLIPGIVLDGDGSTDAATLHLGPTGASFRLSF